MAESRMHQQSLGSATVEQDPVQSERSPTVTLKLKKSEPDKKVKWDEGTVDNEHMNKKKSKCCCIYEKPRVFGEWDDQSDDDDDDNDNDDHGCTDHCRGHRKKDYRRPADGTSPDQSPTKDSASQGADPARDVAGSKY